MLVKCQAIAYKDTTEICLPGEENSLVFQVCPWPWPSDPCSLPHSLMNPMSPGIQPKSLPKIAAMLPSPVTTHPLLAGKIAGGCLNPEAAAQLGAQGELLGAEILQHIKS
jgi:hypothetical protein